jgi:hypothetical protein
MAVPELEDEDCETAASAAGAPDCSVVWGKTSLPYLASAPQFALRKNRSGNE